MKIQILILTLLASLSLHAQELSKNGTLNTSYWFPIHLNEYFENVQKSIKGDAPAAVCQSKYKKVLSKGTLEINYGLGYFDNSTGEDQILDGVNFGQAPSLDVDVYHVIRNKLMAACNDTASLSCGFSENPSDVSPGKTTLTKDITLYDRPVQVRLNLVRGSLTPRYLENTTDRKAEQMAVSRQAEKLFFEDSKTADVIFYNGHSREGGGPDFNPPVHKPDGHVNYGLYQVKLNGIGRVLKLINSRRADPPVMVGMFSCYSNRHFYEKLTKSAPKQALILSVDDINYEDSLQASLGYIEGFMHGECGQGLADIALQTAKSQRGFKAFRF